MMKKYVLFGGGVLAEKWLITNPGIIVEKVFDNYKKDFWGYKVEKPHYERDLFIIVCVHSYLDVRKQLLEMGYAEFEDFVPSNCWKKKIAIMFGNCHADLVKRYLEKNKYFSLQYGFYPIPIVSLIPKEKEFDFFRVFKHIDLLIHQAIRKNNSIDIKYSSEYITAFLNSDCKVIAIPNLHNLPRCFFPQWEIYSPEESDIIQKCVSRPMWYKEKNIFEWVTKGWNKKRILSQIESGTTYLENQIIEEFSEFKDKLIEREKEWDVKISDYILNHYKTVKLFYEPRHITSKLAKEIAIRILNYMGYVCEEISYTLPTCDYSEMFMYPEVIRALGIECMDKTIRIESAELSTNMVEMDLEEYVSFIVDFYRFLFGKEKFSL